VTVGTLLYRVVIVVVVVVVGLGLLSSGGLDTLASTISLAMDRLTTSLRTMLLALSVPALLLGGAIAISPKHRQFGTELAVGGLIGITVATVGPVAMHWLGGTLTTYSSALLGGVR
jgi:hypothetical protein